MAGHRDHHIPLPAEVLHELARQLDCVPLDAVDARYAEMLLRMDRAAKPEDRVIDNPLKHMDGQVLTPLQLALREDPSNVRTTMQLASSTIQRWSLAPLDPSNRQTSTDAVLMTQRARQLNPEGGEGYLGEYEVRTRVAEMLTFLAEQLEKEVKDDEKK